MPDNAGYYYAAYVLSGVIYALYAFSIYLRRKRILEHGRNSDPG